jgi:hypothetical protein
VRQPSYKNEKDERRFAAAKISFDSALRPAQDEGWGGQMMMDGALKLQRRLVPSQLAATTAILETRRVWRMLEAAAVQ